MENSLIQYMQSYLSHLKATVLWFHSAHHVTKGPGFLSDHDRLFGEIYTKIDDHFDELIEKAIALSGDEIVACPANLAIAASHILSNHYESPVNLQSQKIIELSIIVVANLINSVCELHELFDKENMLTLGLDETLSRHSNEYEKYLYFLGQRSKS